MGGCVERDAHRTNVAVAVSSRTVVAWKPRGESEQWILLEGGGMFAYGSLFSLKQDEVEEG